MRHTGVKAAMPPLDKNSSHMLSAYKVDVADIVSWIAVRFLAADPHASHHWSSIGVIMGVVLPPASALRPLIYGSLINLDTIVVRAAAVVIAVILVDDGITDHTANNSAKDGMANLMGSLGRRGGYECRADNCQ